MTGASPVLHLTVQYASQRAGPHAPQRARLRRLARATLTLAGHPEAHLLVRLVDTAEGRALNRAWRGKDYATNVLTFAYGTPLPDTGTHADIILCAAVVEREARAQGKAPGDHYAHLVVHGVLHALGHEHDEPAAAQRMEDLERAVLARFRIADPYA